MKNIASAFRASLILAVIAGIGLLCVLYAVGVYNKLVKTLGPHIASVPGVTGATILGDGRVVVVGAERVLVDDEALKTARLALMRATRQVLRNGLGLELWRRPGLLPRHRGAMGRPRADRTRARDANLRMGCLVGDLPEPQRRLRLSRWSDWHSLARRCCLRAHDRRSRRGQ